LRKFCCTTDSLLVNKNIRTTTGDMLPCTPSGYALALLNNMNIIPPGDHCCTRTMSIAAPVIVLQVLLHDCFNMPNISRQISQVLLTSENATNLPLRSHQNASSEDQYLNFKPLPHPLPSAPSALVILPTTFF